jgi:hypothetical protein
MDPFFFEILKIICYYNIITKIVIKEKREEINYEKMYQKNSFGISCFCDGDRGGCTGGSAGEDSNQVVDAVCGRSVHSQCDLSD